MSDKEVLKRREVLTRPQKHNLVSLHEAHSADEYGYEISIVMITMLMIVKEDIIENKRRRKFII